MPIVPVVPGLTKAGPLADIPRGWWCRVLSRQGGWAEVRYEELNRNEQPNPVIVRFSGWIPADLLAERLTRAFFHLHVAATTPARWTQRAEDRFDFVCHWLPLVPRPVIHSAQQAWLDDHYDALRQSVRRSAE